MKKCGKCGSEEFYPSGKCKPCIDKRSSNARDSVSEQKIWADVRRANDLWRTYVKHRPSNTANKLRSVQSGHYFPR